MSHTPGKWVVHSDCDWSLDTGGSNCYAFVGPEDGEPVAVIVVTAPFGRDDELDSNARLIAAAPDLLAALKRLVEHHASYINDLPGAWGVGDLEAARAAISSASEPRL